MQKEIKLKGEIMANPYGNNGFNRIQGQSQQQAGYGQPQMQRQPQMAGYGQPQQAGYVDPRFANQMQQPMYGQPQQAGYVDPRFTNQMQHPQSAYQQMTPQQIQQIQMQQMQAQQMHMRGQMPGMGLNPMQNMPQPQFGQPTQGAFGQPQQPAAGRAISSIVEDVTPNISQQQPQQNNQPVIEEPKQEINEDVFGPADGSEFPPYYNKSTEKLIKVYNRDTMTYTWKIEKLQK